MLRDDTSPVKARIEEMALSTPEVSFKACGNTQERMHKAENKDIPIVRQAEVVKSGVVRVGTAGEGLVLCKAVIRSLTRKGWVGVLHLGYRFAQRRSA